jgi:hypothetical protein
LDRRFLAIIAMALIVSTEASYFAFLESPEEKVTIIRNSAPEQIRRQVDLELTHKFALGLVTRDKIQELVIQYLFMVPASSLPPSDAPLDKKWESRPVMIRNGLELSADLGFEPEVVQGELELNGERSGYALFNLGAILPSFTEWHLAEDATTSVLIIPRGKDDTTQMKGKSGFYRLRNEIAKVIISRGVNETTYTAQRSAQELEAGERGIDEAPHNGRVVFVDLDPDETISILLELMGRANQPAGSLSVILLYVDGELQDALFNFMG